MRISSFNANGVRSAARKGFFDWFATQDADLLCMQETKAQEHQLAGTDGRHAHFLPAGYKAWFSDATNKKRYSGVRSEEGGVGKACVSQCRSRRSPYHEKKSR